MAQYQLQVKDSEEKVQQIKKLNPDEAQEMLGVHIAPNGDCKVQFEHLMKKATEYGERIQTCYTYRHEAWLGLTTMALKSIEYSLPATTFTEQECDKIMWQLLKHFLPKSGINRYIKRDVLYAPITLQGLGLKNLYITQGLSHINDIVE